MSERRDYEQRLGRSLFTANLRTAIWVQGFVLVMGTLVITKSRASDALMFAVLFTAIQLAWAYFASIRYRLACSGIAVPNIVVALSFLFVFSVAGYSESPIALLWFFSTLLLGLVAVVLARAKGGGDEPPHTVYAPSDDA